MKEEKGGDDPPRLPIVTGPQARIKYRDGERAAFRRKDKWQMRTSAFLGRKAAIVFAIFFFAFAPDVFAGSIDNSARVALQSTLRGYIEGKTADGRYTFFDETTGDVQVLNLKKIHPVIFEKNGRFLMCADFLGQQGQDVLVDYIVVSGNEGFLVEKEIRGRRPMLMEIFEKVF